MMNGQPDLLGYCDRCDSIHRPSEPHKGAVADGGLVAEGEVTDAFLRARLATAYRTEGEILCGVCEEMVDLSKGSLAPAIAAWNDHAADCGGED